MQSLDQIMSKSRRHGWKFEYSAEKVARGAEIQQAFRETRVKWWEEQKAKVMQEIKDSGIEVTESIAAQIANYATTANVGPRITIRADLQSRLSECHTKIAEHLAAVAEYEGWVQVLRANSEAVLKLTHTDWLFFFRTR